MTTIGRVLVLSDDAPFAKATCAILAAQLPEASCEGVPPAHVRASPEASAVVLDGRGDVPAMLDRAQLIRAMGFVAPLVIVGASDEATTAAAARYGYVLVSAERLADDLMPQLAEAVAASQTPFGDAVRRARRLVAAGTVALGLQHSLNNPLAAILAESQLLQLDETTAEQGAALDRIVGMCRRMIDILRGLDGVGEHKIR